jgi:hypothetical protein
MVIPVLLYGSECWTLTEQISRIVIVEMHFLMAVVEYCLIDEKQNEDTRKQFHVTYVITRIRVPNKIMGTCGKDGISVNPKILFIYDPGRPQKRWKVIFF